MNCYLAYCYLNKHSKGFIKQRNSESAHGCFWQPDSDEKAVSGIPYKLHSKGNYDVQFFIELEVNLCNVTILKTEFCELRFFLLFQDAYCLYIMLTLVELVIENN